MTAPTSADRCPECFTPWTSGVTCQDHFHQMLFWENEFPSLGEVHHLMVLSYYLQHPSLYSPEGLEYSKGLLIDFVVHGKSSQEVRQASQEKVNSTNRKWNISSRHGNYGSYTHPVRWKMTAQDVIAAGSEHYKPSVRKWAESIYYSLQESNNLPAG